MKCIVPLAGPDFYHPRFGAKALHTSRGAPLVRRALRSRAWVKSGSLRDEDLIFVLRNGPQLDEVSAFLTKEFEGSAQAIISRPTRGALASALVGAGLLDSHQAPVVIDLVDIIYECSADVPSLFGNDPTVAGVIPHFSSSLPSYSYLELEENRVRRTREKEVISSHASAGTYFFKDAATFLQAAQGSLTPDARLKTVFVCPSYNALIAAGRSVIGVEVSAVEPIAWPPHAVPEPASK